MQTGSNWRATILASVIVIALPVFGQDAISADRPGIADSSTVVTPKTFQVEVGIERDESPDLTTTPLLLRYGLAKQLELRFETAGWSRAPHRDGLAPASIGVKYHFLDTPSLGVIARVFPPSGSGIFRSHTASEDVRLAIDHDLNDVWSFEGNVGLAHAGGDNVATAAATLQYNVTPKINVFVDAGATASPSSLILDAGSAWVIGNDLQLDVSFGWRAHGDVPERFVAAGIARRF